MGNQQIKLDMDGIENTLEKLRNSIDDLTSYTTTFCSNTQDQLEGFNSDFITKVDDVLESIHDEVNQDLINEMEVIHQEGKTIFNAMKSVDEEAANAIEGDQS